MKNSPSLKDLPQLEAVEQEETGPKGKKRNQKNKNEGFGKMVN